MVILQRKKPIILQKYEAIYYRLSKRHAKIGEIEKEVYKRRRGYAGERKVDYYLDMLADRFTILQDVCLLVYGKNLQIDHLVITPHAHFIVETKNYKGTITFDTILKQLIQKDGERESGYKYPMTQAEMQSYQLEQWFVQQHLPKMPMYHLVAISEPETIIDVIGDRKQIAEVVFHAASIPQKIMEIEKGLIGGAIYQHQKVGYAIKNQCTTMDRDVLAYHGIRPDELISGVFCPDCGGNRIPRVHGGWKCPTCKKKYRDAHRSALDDYLMLVKPWITNSECMRWLNFNSKNIATRILEDYGLHYDGERRRWTIN